MSAIHPGEQEQYREEKCWTGNTEENSKKRKSFGQGNGYYHNAGNGYHHNNPGNGYFHQEETKYPDCKCRKAKIPRFFSLCKRRKGRKEKVCAKCLIWSTLEFKDASVKLDTPLEMRLISTAHRFLTLRAQHKWQEAVDLCTEVLR